MLVIALDWRGLSRSHPAIRHTYRSHTNVGHPADPESLSGQRVACCNDRGQECADLLNGAADTFSCLQVEIGTLGWCH